FGGFNVIMCGDQHQFPLVANALGALYCNLPNDMEEGTRGRALHRQFTTVVSLTKQHRVDDPVWNNMLLRLRVGECMEEDVEMVKGQMLEKMPTDFTVPPWNDIAFLTAHNETRKQWNEATADRLRDGKKQWIYISPAKDIGKKKALTLSDRAQIASMGPVMIAKLRDQEEMAVGMSMMVLFNIATEADMANGSKGVIDNIILDSREPEPVAD
ncbi:hypothetical protein C8J56DRAFT_728077, partial [Mycena floridula]